MLPWQPIFRGKIGKRPSFITLAFENGLEICSVSGHVNSGNYLAPHTHTHTQPFYGSMDFAWDNAGEPVPEETFAHLHLSWLLIVPYLLLPSNTIHGILPEDAMDRIRWKNFLPVQSTFLTVFLYNLSPSFLWSTSSWPGILHFIGLVHKFLHPIIVFFSQHTPIPLQPVLLQY